MEKAIPHRKLSVIHSLVKQGKMEITRSARDGAEQLDLDFAQMIDVILNVTSAEFQKSMTTKTDHTVWQDVYKTRVNKMVVYFKFTIEDLRIPKQPKGNADLKPAVKQMKDSVLIVSFKESTS